MLMVDTLMAHANFVFLLKVFVVIWGVLVFKSLLGKI